MRSLAGAIGAAILYASAPAGRADTALPTPDHIVLVLMENHAFGEVIDRRRAPFLFRLAAGGALFLNAYAVAHPSEPNYFVLFSGSTHGVDDDGVYDFDSPTLAGALAAAHRSFLGYVEADSPRKHNPWESFADARGMERDLSAFPRDFAALPTVSFIIPNLDHDMHDRSVNSGDRWLRMHLGAYAEWAKKHNSLLIITFDEDDLGSNNHIATIVYGAGVRTGRYAQRVTHYNLLSTLLAMYDLPPLGDCAAAPPIRDIWWNSARAAADRKPTQGPKL